MARAPFTTRFIDPAVLTRVRNLQLVARTVVEGFLAGLHRSPYHGFSLEFAEYREYSPGDDIRRVDWKVFGRSDRFYVKKYEGETNTQLYILLDASRSMSFSSHPVSKLDYARFLTAALAYFAVHQKDATALLTFDSDVLHYIPPRSRHGHFFTILHHLEHLSVGDQTNIIRAMEKLARLIRKRSLVVVISDFYQDPDGLSRLLRLFHARGNDVVLFHVLDPVELEMPLDGMSILEDLETGERLPYVQEYSREAYLEQVRHHIGRLRKECFDLGFDYSVLDTEKPLDRALYRYLSRRMKKGG